MKKRILSIILVLVMVAGVLPTVAYAYEDITVTYNPGTNGEGSVRTDIVDFNANYQVDGAIYTRTGYVQTGWATSDGGAKMYLCEYTISCLRVNLNLYPTWAVASYPVTVNVNKDGSAWGAGAPTITFGATVGSAVANGTYVGNGTYNIYANGTDTGVDVTVSGSAASVDLNYYTVTFKSQDGSTALDTKTVLSGQTAEYVGAPPTKTSTAEYTYAFSNWVTAANGSDPATLTNITAAKTVYASYTSTLLSYAITWKKDDANTIDISNVAYGGMPTQSVPLNTGYTFSGWTPSIVSVTGAATYTATWTLATYNISYTLNGGTVASANPANYTIESADIPLNNPERTGYSFIGWSGTGLAGNTTQTVTIDANSTGNKTYTANWKANTPAAPDDSIVTAKTDRSFTITTSDGYEYSVGGNVWHCGDGSFTFTGLTTGWSYNLICRVAAVTSGNISQASNASPNLTVQTKSTGSITAPTPDAVTYNPDVTLADITLPAGWAWSTAATIPTVTNSGYSAVYIPADTETVDYSGVEGYANSSGTVTVTRTIPLTVNRATPTAANFTYTAPASLDYSGTTKTSTVTANGDILGMGAVTVSYYLDGVETSPTNVGTYTVKIDIAQGDNYAAATAVTDDAWTFTIGKVAQVALTITNKPTIVTYGDTFTLSTLGGSGTGAVTWAVTDGTSADVNASTGAVTITGVGQTIITATRAADDNYLAAVTDTYTFIPSKLELTFAFPTAIDGWTKTYDGTSAFDISSISVGSITNKVGADDVSVSAQSATYDTADVGSGDKELTITFAIDGADIENYSVPADALISNASITAATPTVTLEPKTSIYTGNIIEIAAATVTGVTGGTAPDGAVTYTYYTKDTCTDADKTTVDKSGAEAVGGAPKNGATYYVTATIAASGNYTAAASTAVTLTIYYPSSGVDKSSAPVIVDGKTVDMGTSEVKDGTTTVAVDQNKMSEQLKSATDSVVIPITSKTDTAAAQLVVQNVESMAERGVRLTIIAGDISYSIPSGAIDTSAALKVLGASDSSKVPLNITISKLSNSSVTIHNGTLMVPPVAFTVTATYSGKSVEVERFASYVQRVIEIPDGTNPESITTAVVVEVDGTQRHVPTEVYSENGKWYARINAMTNSTYALIQNSASFTDTAGKWYEAAVTEMASREIISGIGDNMFAGERAITRAEFAAIIVRALGLPTDSTAAGAFSDVSANQWYYGAVGTAYEYSLVTGKSEGQFDPTGNITRQEAMAMIARAAKLAGYTGKVDTISGFSDVDEIGGWASDAVKFNVGSGLIVGSNGRLRPQDEISRAETATVVLRLLQNSNLIDVRD